MSSSATVPITTSNNQSCSFASASSTSASQYSNDTRNDDHVNPVNKKKNKNKRPLPLKQRTASVDGRRDYTPTTWVSLLNLLPLQEYMITVDHFSIWKRHIAWAIPDGKDLRDYMTQRYSSSMIFLSLLLSMELSILFNPGPIVTNIRLAMDQQKHTTIYFWTGIMIILSIVLTLMGLIATFTAWAMVSAISPKNAHCILRSSMGQYVSELPGQYIVGALYTFFVWLTLLLSILLPSRWFILLAIIILSLFVHTITTFSAFGRILMHTSAMSSQPIFEPTFESDLPPQGLHRHLLFKAQTNLTNGTSIRRQYMSINPPFDHRTSLQSSQDSTRTLFTTDDTDYDTDDSHQVSSTQPIQSSYDSNYIHSYSDAVSASKASPLLAPLHAVTTKVGHKRNESLVKFADGYDTIGAEWNKQRDASSASINTSNESSAGTFSANNILCANDQGGALPSPLSIDSDGPTSKSSIRTKTLDMTESGDYSTGNRSVNLPPRPGTVLLRHKQPIGLSASTEAEPLLPTHYGASNTASLSNFSSSLPSPTPLPSRIFEKPTTQMMIKQGSFTERWIRSSISTDPLPSEDSRSSLPFEMTAPLMNNNYEHHHDQPLEKEMK